MASTGMLILGNVCFAVRGTDFSMYPQHTIRLNHHLRADALLLMISALAFFSYPDYVATIMVCAYCTYTFLTLVDVHYAPIIVHVMLRLAAAWYQVNRTISSSSYSRSGCVEHRIVSYFITGFGLSA